MLLRFTVYCLLFVRYLIKLRIKEVHMRYIYFVAMLFIIWGVCFLAATTNQHTREIRPWQSTPTRSAIYSCSPQWVALAGHVKAILLNGVIEFTNIDNAEAVVLYARTGSQRQPCGSSVRIAQFDKVFLWLVKEAQHRNILLMPAYGTLLRIFRNQSIGWKDDDADAWSTPEGMLSILALASQLKERFDWGIRIMGSRMVQLFSFCGTPFRNPSTLSKIDFPGGGIDLYFLKETSNPDILESSHVPMVTVGRDVMFPPKTVERGNITFQVPNQSILLLECFFGKETWKAPGPKQPIMWFTIVNGSCPYDPRNDPSKRHH